MLAASDSLQANCLAIETISALKIYTDQPVIIDQIFLDPYFLCNICDRVRMAAVYHRCRKDVAGLGFHWENAFLHLRMR